MKSSLKAELFLRTFVLLGLLAVVSGCTSLGIERHKYIFWGDIVPGKPTSIRDHWSDYGPFRLDDPNAKLRRGKAGVIRFFTEKDYSHSIAVDGDLVVYVYSGNEEGVELTEPFARLFLTSEQLNHQRKFDKKNGYSYHIWLDLGVVDDPPENISILTVFNDAETRDQVASGITYTRIEGLETISKEKDAHRSEIELSEDTDEMDPVEWARKYRDSNPSAKLTKEEKQDTVQSENDFDHPEATVIDLSPAMAQQLQKIPQQQNHPEESRYAAYLDAKEKGRWVEAPAGTDLNAMAMTAMRTPEPMGKQISPTNHSISDQSLRERGNSQGLSNHKLSFDELRNATGPSANGEYFTQGYVSKEGQIKADQPYAIDGSKLY